MSDDLDLTSKERDLIRREFMAGFGEARSLHAGIMLKRWATGERKGEPKVPTVVQGLIDRGLVELADLDKHWPTARFTPAGFRALRRMVADKRALNERDHAKLLAEIAALPDGD